MHSVKKYAIEAMDGTRPTHKISDTPFFGRVLQTIDSFTGKRVRDREIQLQRYQIKGENGATLIYLRLILLSFTGITLGSLLVYKKGYPPQAVPLLLTRLAWLADYGSATANAFSVKKR